jgi:hypothetical protein
MEMRKAEVINTIKKLLDVEVHLTFQEKLTIEELERLTAYIRDRIESPPPKPHRL